MITFNVVKEPHGWAVRMGEQMSAPYWSKTQALQEAACMAQAIRRHGASVEVVVEGEGDVVRPHERSRRWRAPS